MLRRACGCLFKCKNLYHNYLLLLLALLVQNLPFNQLCSAYNIKDYLIDHEQGYLTTRTWSIKLHCDNDLDDLQLNAKASSIAQDMGMVNLGQVGLLRGHYVFASNEVNASTPSHLEVEWHCRQEVLKRVKRYPVRRRMSGPVKLLSDTLVDPLFPKQWHLHNGRKGGKDCNVTGVWDRNVTGRGVIVSIVDDGVEWKHPDLINSYSPEASFDLNADDDDPTPELDDKGENKHGTRCAGEVAAVANDICGVGIAFGAKFSGIRILDGPMTDSLEATAFSKRLNVIDVYSCSWGPEDDGLTVDGPRGLANAALQHGVVSGRGGFGSIFIVASGNGGLHDDNCNYDGYANSLYTITIAAVDEYGDTPSYAEQCTSMLACTVSSGDFRSTRSIATTDWTLDPKNSGQCTTHHTGTSAATPLVAGMVALMLEVRPCLQWRDVQHIVVITAVPLIGHHGRKHNLVKNKAGFYHSNHHGFGLLDAWRLVNAAKVWPLVPWLTSVKPSCPGVKLPINGGASEPLTVRTTVTSQQCEEHLLKTLETVQVAVDVTHPSRGRLKFIITCPSGTQSIILPRKNDLSKDGLSNWSFATVKCWGESANGTYMLTVIDTVAGNEEVGILRSWQITLYGSKLTPNDIESRRRLVQRAYTGEYISPESNFSLPCPARRHVTFDVTGFLSEKTLKLVVMLSCFSAVWAIYYTLEMAFCNAEDKNVDEAAETAGSGI